MKIALFLFLTGFLCAYQANAQDSLKISHAKQKKTSPGPLKQHPGFYPASKSTSEKNPVKNNSLPELNQLKAANAFPENSPIQNNGPVIEYNINDLDPEVRKRINENKQSGKHLFSGIARRFDVEILSILTDNDRIDRLGFLQNKKGILRSVFISPGRVFILTDAAFESVQLKEMLSTAHMNFDFLKEQFQLAF